MYKNYQFNHCVISQITRLNRKNNFEVSTVSVLSM